ncbi:hypothetical protein D9756_002952 [Leucocoprinus leucothites]|uniref:Protein kinase domain-containing protein n=1 Tax=Leucocoprinus leucothites TaxID=201217 RepID=A0A8H5LJM9_9AGAR|nr:hypothetical protein D9756_002952 [Leucoagaricus leucothites]
MKSSKYKRPFFHKLFRQVPSSPTTGFDADNIDLYRKCRILFTEVITSVVGRELIAELTDSEARTMAIFLRKLLDNQTALSEQERKDTLHTLSVLAKSAQLELELESVQCDFSQPISVDDSGCVYKGKYDNQLVRVQAIRVHRQDVSPKSTLKAHAGELAIRTYLSHPNILPFYGLYFTHESFLRVCIVSPWIEHGDLVQYLREFPDTSRISLLHDIISGLQYLHGLDIVHGDLKPRNIVVTRENRAMLAEFGLSRIVVTLASYASHLSTGTPAYLVPEMLLEDDDTPKKESDIWAFGCTCYEVLTGNVPFYQYRTASQLIRAFMAREAVCSKPEPIRWGSLEEQAWSKVEQCMEYDPDRRPTSEELLRSFTELNISDRRQPDVHSRKAIRSQQVSETSSKQSIVHYDKCCTLLMEIEGSSSSRRNLLGLRGEDAQAVADFLNKLLGDATLSQTKMKETLHLLARLVRSALVFPKSLFLQGARCELGHPVAEGGFGTIYKGTYKGQPVSFKAMRYSEDYRQNLKAQARELIFWAHLSHQNILPFLGIYHSTEKVQRICFISPWMENGDLVQYLQANPDIPRIPLLHDIINGLEYLHMFGIVHGDLKAKNVFISATQRGLLSDFGTVRLSETMTSTTTSMGTVHWQAPELFRDENSAPTKESDIWAFACTCYEVSTGLIPFHEYKPWQLIAAFVQGKVIPEKPQAASLSNWDEFDSYVWPLALSCWKYAPESRPTATQLLDSIVKFNIADNRPKMELEATIPRSDTNIDYDHVYRVLRQVQSNSATKEETADKE